jgi:hypothetical protein
MAHPTAQREDRSPERIRHLTVRGIASLMKVRRMSGKAQKISRKIRIKAGPETEAAYEDGNDRER